MGEMLHLGVNLVEEFTLWRRGAGVGRTSADSAKPFRGVSERRCNVPADENESQASDQNGLQKCSEERVANGIGEALIDVTGVEDDQNRSSLFRLAMKRQRVSVNGKAADIQIVGRAGVELVGACCDLGTVFEIFGVVRSDAQDLASAIVNHHSQQVFALGDFGNAALKIFVCGTTGRGLDAFLEGFGQCGGAVGKIVAQIAPLGAVLISGVEKRYQRHTESERQN